MARQDNTGVDAAFEILLEEIESVIEEVNQSGGRAFSDGKLEVVKQTLTQAQTLTDYRSSVASLRESWGALYAVQDEEVREIISKRDLGGLKKGIRTKEAFYYSPILKVLCNMGGRGEIGEVLDQVHVLVKDSLKPVDKEPLASDPKVSRWRNAACWARCSMVKEGLLRADSPRGVWEIAEAGSKWLKKNGGQGA